MLPKAHCRVLICCTCHFQSSSLLFILASSVCRSLQCLISTLTQDGEGGHLFRLICSVVLWGERDTAKKKKKRKWHVWGLLAVYGPHWVCPSSQQCVLSGSTLLRMQGTLQGHCPTQALHFMHFPGLSHSGSRVLCKGTTRLGVRFLPFPCLSSSGNQVFGKRTVPGGPCILTTSPVAMSAVSQVCHVSPLGS